MKDGLNVITGATGHIGNVLARELVEQSKKVRALVLENDDLRPLDGPNIEIARIAGVLASVYYRLVRRQPVFTAYSIDVLKSNSVVSSARARDELGFTTRPWQDSIHDQVEWFRSKRMLSERK